MESADDPPLMETPRDPGLQAERTALAGAAPDWPCSSTPCWRCARDGRAARPRSRSWGWRSWSRPRPRRCAGGWRRRHLLSGHPMIAPPAIVIAGAAGVTWLACAAGSLWSRRRADRPRPTRRRGHARIPLPTHCRCRAGPAPPDCVSNAMPTVACAPGAGRHRRQPVRRQRARRRTGQSSAAPPWRGRRAHAAARAAQPDALATDRDAGGLEGTGDWQGLRYRVALRLAAAAPAWFWHVRVENTERRSGRASTSCCCRTSRSRRTRARAPERVLRQPIRRPHAARARRARHRARIAAEPGGRHAPSVVRHRIAATLRGLRDRRAAGARPGQSRRSARAPARTQGLPATAAAARALDGGAAGRGPRTGTGESARARLVRPPAGRPSAGDLAERSGVRRRDARLARGPAAGTAQRSADRAGGIEPFRDGRSAAACWTLGRSARSMRCSAPGAVTSSAPPMAALLVLLPRRRTATSCCAPRSCARAAPARPAAAHRHASSVPDESALTSTVWMGGVFHSMLTQGHVSINRCLSTVHSYLGLFRSHGLRVFVELEGAWQSARPAFGVRDAARRAAAGSTAMPPARSTCAAEARSEPHALRPRHRRRRGARAALPRLALTSRSTATTAARRGACAGGAMAGPIVLAPAPASDARAALPARSASHRAVAPDTRIEQRRAATSCCSSTARSRELPYLMLVTAPARAVRFTHPGPISSPTDPTCPRRCAAEPDRDASSRARAARHRDAGALAEPLVRASPSMLPWLAHNALVHYLVAARPRAVLGRRLGHARRLPGPGRAAARARSRARRCATCCCAS